MTANNAPLPGSYRARAMLTPQVIRPGRSSVRTTFQLASEVDAPNGMTIDAVFAGAARTVMKWLDEKLPEVLPKQALDLECFEVDHCGQQQVLCISLPEEGLWSIRLIQPDAPFLNRPAVAGRTWTTELALHKGADSVELAARVLCVSAPYAMQPIALTRPRVIVDLAQEFGLREARPLDGRPWVLATKADVQSLYDFVIHKGRMLPVILLTQPDRRQYQMQIGEYVLDSEALARRTQGLAHVVCIPQDLGFLWTEQVGKVWSAFHGAVRSYYPRLKFDEDPPFLHPRALLDDILFWEHDNQKGEAAFAWFLIAEVSQFAATKSIDWGNCLFFADARARRAEVMRERLKLEMQSVPLADEGAIIPVQVVVPPQDTDEEDAEPSQIEVLQQAHAEEVKALQARIAEAQKDVEEFDDLAAQYKMESERLDRENRSLQAQNDALRYTVERKTGEQADAALAIPDDYPDMPEWVETQLAGRLVFHPRAVQSIKGAAYEDVELVYRSLLLLANEYWNMRLGLDGAKQAWEAGLGRLELRFGRSISRERAGEQGDTYFVRYPLGTEQSQFVEHHLRKGSTKDDRYCLGIYFFYDDDTNQVVIGSLPAHLDTRAT